MKYDIVAYIRKIWHLLTYWNKLTRNSVMFWVKCWRFLKLNGASSSSVSLQSAFSLFSIIVSFPSPQSVIGQREQRQSVKNFCSTKISVHARKLFLVLFGGRAFNPRNGNGYHVTPKRHLLAQKHVRCMTYMRCPPRRPPFYFFEYFCQKSTNFNNFWYVKSWENLTWICYRVFHLTCQM